MDEDPLPSVRISENEPQDAKNDLKARKKKPAAHIFVLCPRLAEHALALGVDAFVACMTFARGTQGDNRTTSWGAHAMEERDLLTRSAAKAAIAALEKRQLITPAGKRYRRKLAEPSKDRKPLFLPNVLVDGVEGRTPPLARIRETRNPDAARLLLRFYEMCDLPGHGGIPLSMLREEHGLRRIGRRGEFTVYDLTVGDETVSGAQFSAPFMLGRSAGGRKGERDAGWAERFWPALRVLRSLHLVETAIVVLDAPFEEGGHPVAMAGGGESAEADFAEVMRAAATQLAARVMTRAQEEYNSDPENLASIVATGSLLVLPTHIRTPFAYSLFRPRYLPDTSLTRGWLRGLEKWIERARDLERAAGLR